MKCPNLGSDTFKKKKRKENLGESRFEELSSGKKKET